MRQVAAVPLAPRPLGGEQLCQPLPGLYQPRPGTSPEDTANVLGNIDATLGSNEKYGHSMYTVRSLGRLGVANQVEVAPGVVERRHTPESLGMRETVYDDFKTKVTEMLANDKEIGHLFDINRTKAFSVVGNKMMSPGGESFESIFSRGVVSAKIAAAKDERLQAEVTRAEGDLIVQRAVDKLEVGQTYYAISMEPKHELEQFKKLYGDQGYELGKLFIQPYTKVDQNTIIAGSYSAIQSDEDRWRQTAAEWFGMDIPAGTSPNEYTRHGAVVQEGARSADERVRAARADYYRRSGMTQKRYSATEFVEANDVLLQAIFDQYIDDFADAAALGVNNRIIQSFASEIMRGSTKNMNPELAARLRQIASSEMFDDQHARDIESALCYAAVESLRPGAKQFVNGANLNNIAQDTAQRQAQLASLSPAERQAAMNAMMASSISAGVEAGRDYTSCGGSSNLAKGLNDKDDPGSKLRKQLERNKPGESDDDEKESAAAKTEEKNDVGEKSWGTCVIEGCRNSGENSYAEVGGCSICLGECQELYDASLPIDAEAYWKREGLITDTLGGLAAAFNVFTTNEEMFATAA